MTEYAERLRVLDPGEFEFARPTLELEMIDELVSQIEARFGELEGELSDPAVIGDRERFTAASRAYRELEAAAKLANEYRRVADDLEGARELLAEDGDDSELRALLESSRTRLEELEDEIRLVMVERDPNDDKNVIVEIRPGAGGDEAGLWAGDLYRMLTRYADRAGSRPSRCRSATGRTRSRSRATGRTRCSSSRAGLTACSGSRRPSPRAASTPRRRRSRCFPKQRRSRSRSTRTIFRSTCIGAPGPGGQSVNTTDSAVRITHKPSGIVVSMQDEKSQLQNRERAMRVLRARLYERALAEQQAEVAASRAAQVGTGERAEKIRTYNYGERRVKDHRINLLLHNLDEILMGELDELTGALQDDEKRRRLEEKASGLTPPSGPVSRSRRRCRMRPPRWPPPAATRRDSTPSCCCRTCWGSGASGW